MPSGEDEDLKAFYEAEWDFVKKNFFPRWDREGKWKLEIYYSPHFNGICLCDERLVLVSPRPGPDKQGRLRIVMIHEIAHAVTLGSHGEHWQNRMKIAEKRAMEIGLAALATALRKNVAKYEGCSEECCRNEQVYCAISWAVWEHPRWTFDRVMSHICPGYCPLTQEFFLRQYKLSRQTYDEAKERWRIARDAQKEVTELIAERQDLIRQAAAMQVECQDLMRRAAEPAADVEDVMRRTHILKEKSDYLTEWQAGLGKRTEKLAKVVDRLYGNRNKSAVMN